MSTFDDWRSSLDSLAAGMRELEHLRRECEELQDEAAEWRTRAGMAERELEARRTRDRVRAKLSRVDPSLAGVDICFGQTEADAVPVPQGPGNAQFVLGMCDLLLENDRPIYFKAERRPVAPVVAIPDESARGER